MPAQKISRIGPSSTRARSERRLAARIERGPKTQPVLRRVVVGAEDEAGGGVGAGAGGDDVLRGAAEEQAAQQVEAGVLVEVERGGGDQDHREPDRAGDQRDQAAGDRERDVEGDRQRVLGVDVGRLDLGPAARARAAARRASRRPAARRRCRASGPRRSRASRSAPGGRRRPRAGIIAACAGYRSGCAGVAELAYAMDSKSIARKGLWVRVPPPALPETELRVRPAAARPRRAGRPAP